MPDEDPDTESEAENEVPESIQQEAEGTLENFREWVNEQLEDDSE